MDTSNTHATMAAISSCSSKMNATSAERTLQWFNFHSVDDQVSRLAESIIAELSSLLASQPSAVLAVSGGRSPIPLFRKLATADLDWARVVLTLVDERFVADSHPHSNAQLVKTYLLTGQAAIATFRPLVTVLDDVKASVLAATHCFRQPDVAILGMGEDGHTASLFPGAAELAQGLDLATPCPIIALTPPVAPYLRLTLTRAVLMKARRLYLAIQGETKRDVLMQACKKETVLLPISYFVHQTKVPLDVYWVS